MTRMKASGKICATVVFSSDSNEAEYSMQYALRQAKISLYPPEFHSELLGQLLVTVSEGKVQDRHIIPIMHPLGTSSMHL